MAAAAKKYTAETNRKFKARQATEKRILEAATEVFTQRGFAAATIAEMVKRSNLSRGAFYVHFTNKRNVFFALVSRAVADLYEVEPLQPGDSWRSSIRASIRGYLRAFARHRGIMRCLFETSTSDPEVGAMHNTYRTAFAEQLATQIDQQIRGGRFRKIDARATSYCLGALISGAAYRLLCADFDAWPDDPMTEDRLVDTITDIWCQTMFVDAADVDDAPSAAPKPAAQRSRSRQAPPPSPRLARSKQAPRVRSSPVKSTRGST